jgi:hypothetical protein
MPAAAVPVPKIPSFGYNAADSTVSNIGTTGADYIQITTTGIYDINWLYNQTGGTNADRNFIEISIEGVSPMLARVSFANGEDSATATVTGMKLNAGQRLTFSVYQWGSPRPYVSKVRIKRVAGPTPTAGFQSGNITHTGDLTVQGKFTQQIKHCTTNVATSYVPHATLWGPGTFSTNSGQSVNTGFISFSSDSFTVSETGVYAIHILSANHSTTHSAARIFLRDLAGNIITETAKAEGGVWGINFAIPNLYIVAGSGCQIKFLQESGGTQQWDTTLRVTKIQ